jgi:hypothetical protein
MPVVHAKSTGVHKSGCHVAMETFCTVRPNAGVFFSKEHLHVTTLVPRILDMPRLLKNLVTHKIWPRREPIPCHSNPTFICLTGFT